MKNKKLLLHQLYLAKKTKAERKFIKEEKRRNAVAFQVFLTQRNFLCAEYLMARFSWGSNMNCKNQSPSANPAAIPTTADEAIIIIGLIFFFKVKKSAAPNIAREI